MAEKDVNVHLNLNKNSIKDVRTQTPSGAPHDDDVMNRKYIDDKTKYDTTLATTQPTAEAMGGIPKATPSATVANKTIKQILDLALYPLKPPTYTVPTVVASITNLADIVVTEGFRTNIVLKVTPTLNDSPSVVSYTFSGAGITGTVTQATDTFTINNYALIEGDNTWTVGINYAAANTKNDTHGNADNTGKFAAGSVTNQVKITTKLPILYSVDYENKDITASTAANVPSDMDCRVPNPSNKFDIVVGNNKAASVNIAVPKSTGDIKVTQDGIDITSAFSRVVKNGVKPEGAYSVANDYAVFHQYTNVALPKPTKYTVEVFQRFYTSITDVYYDGQDNKVRVDSGTLTNSWNTGTDTPYATNNFSIKKIANGLRIVSTVGNIKRVEIGHPYKVVGGLNTTDTSITLTGFSQKLLDTEVFKLRIWVSNGTPTHGDPSIPNG